MLSEERWQDHVLVDHDELIGQEALVEPVLTSPFFVRFDARFTTRENFYRRRDALTLKTRAPLRFTLPSAKRRCGAATSCTRPSPRCKLDKRSPRQVSCCSGRLHQRSESAPNVEHMAELLRWLDHWGREIVLTEERWEDHVLAGHGELRVHLAAVEVVLTDPLVVTFDSKITNRENYYRPHLPPEPYQRLFLKICVEFLRIDQERSLFGDVITAYPTGRIPEAEARKWP